MNLPKNSFVRVSAALAVAGAVLCSGIRAEDSIEVRELRAALEMAQKEKEQLERELGAAEVQRRTLVKSLSEAVRVSEEQVAAAREMQLKLQAFGVDLFTQDENSLEQRLLKAVRDLDIAEQDLERRRTELHKLSEAFLKYVQSTPEVDEKARGEAMAAIETAGTALSEIAAAEDAAAGDVSGSRVVSIDSEIGLVVVDAGRGTGLRVGTPIALLREGRPIYTAMVVDVRDSISGAVLQDRLADADQVAVGDGVRLLPNQPSF